jgi:starch synthase
MIAGTKLIIAHPTGNANARQVMQALADDDLICEIHTTIATFSSSLVGCFRRIPGLAELQRRSFGDSLRPFMRTHPWRESIRLAALRLGWRGLIENGVGWASIDRVCSEIDTFTARRTKRLRLGGVYCYEDCALQTFHAAGEIGVKRIYDLPIGYWRAARQILQEEANRRPKWAPTLGGLNDSKEKLDRKDEELQLADRILVASSFTKQTLERCPFPIAPIAMIPYGADDSSVGAPRQHQAHHGRPLKVLFVGGLSQRKGIADLFEAVNMLGAHIELTVIGRKPLAACAVLDSGLQRHAWIESLPREQILQEMRVHDVLVFPSLFEGFGLVVTEALSQGLPVITTPHTCGPDVLTEGEDGFIVPIRDPQAIAEKLELLHRDRGRLAAMSEAAVKKAKTLTWERYRQGVVEVVRETLASKSA